MATIPTRPDVEVAASISAGGVPSWPRGTAAPSHATGIVPVESSGPSHRDALQALLAFAALHEQLRKRKALAARLVPIDAGTPTAEFDQQEQFVLDEVLQLVAERAIAITGADGLAIALAENNEIVLRAAAGSVRPDIGARIDRDSAFSGACFREAQIVTCDDTETDPRVNVQACRKLGARSMVAVPLCGRRRVIGLLEAFSSWPFGFNDSDVRNLTLLAELILGALKPEDEDRFALSAQVASANLPPAPKAIETPAPPIVVTQPATVEVKATASAPMTPAQRVPEAQPVTRPEPATKIETAPAPAPAVPDAAALSAILEKPLAEPAKAAIPAVAHPEVAPEPALNLGPIEHESKNRPIMPALLVGIVILVAFAGGVWWKVKTAQLGSAMVQTEKTAPKPETAPVPAPVTAPAASAPAAPAIDAATDSGPENTAPATPQELSKFPRVTGIRHWSSADSSTVVLDLEDQVQYEAHRLANPDRIYFDLHDTQLAAELVGKAIDVGDPLLSRVRVAQPVAGMTRIVLETKSNTTFSVSLEPNPYRLVVEVHKVGSTPKGAVNLFPNAAEAEKTKLAIVIPPPTKEDLQLRARVPKMRIVVDAGHGGWDLGTVGRRGLLEKDLVLEISQRLGKLLESRLGADVVYTRPDDNYITLDERASIANQSQADLFVSVHANYSDLPSARGVETYYTNFFSAPGSKEVGSNSAAPQPVALRPATSSLSPAELHDRIEQSRRLAASVQRSLYGTLSVQNPGLRDRGIKEASFVVLTESAMPGILAEVSFVSSPTDEQRLRSDGYREQIAEALYHGIARYAAAGKGVKVASAAK